MTFHIITIFPEIFESYFKFGVLRSAIEKKIVKIKVYDLRDYTDDKRRTVDDTVYGGGAGMLLKVEPIWKCVEKIKSEIRKSSKARLFPSSSRALRIPQSQAFRTILFCARGRRFDQAQAKRLTKYTDVIMICGRYEGLDERVAQHIADETSSIGEFILTGGEIPAMIFVDTMSRFLPGVLGNSDSSVHESFETKGYLEYPQYTKPAEFRGWKVPKILLSGDHKKINEWREKKSRHYEAR